MHVQSEHSLSFLVPLFPFSFFSRFSHTVHSVHIYIHTYIQHSWFHFFCSSTFVVYRNTKRFPLQNENCPFFTHLSGLFSFAFLFFVFIFFANGGIRDVGWAQTTPRQEWFCLSLSLTQFDATDKSHRAFTPLLSIFVREISSQRDTGRSPRFWPTFVKTFAASKTQCKSIVIFHFLFLFFLSTTKKILTNRESQSRFLNLCRWNFECPVMVWNFRQK